MKKLLTVLLAVLMLFATAAGCSQQTSGTPLSGLVISEVVSSNSSSLIDPVFGNPDWIELYNASDKALDLSGFAITEAGRNKFEFPEGSQMEAGAYLLVYCCASIDDQAGQYCTGFKLSKSGAELKLSSPYGTVQELSVPGLESDISYGADDKGVYHYYPNPTPGAANSGQGFESIEEISSKINDKLKISEILPQSVTDADPYAWIELYNSGDTAIDLSEYYITENLSDPKKAKMPQMSLESGQYALLRFTGIEGDAQIPFKISSEESTVAILDVFANVIDKISWDAATPAGISAGKGDADKMVYYKQPTPGAANGTDTSDSIVITDGTSDVTVSEILQNNSFSIIDEDGDRSPWVELHNTSGQAVNLADYALSDDKARLLKYRLPSVDLAPDGYVIVYLSGKEKSDAEIHANFKIGSDETQLFLTNINACTAQTIDLPAETKDNVSYGLAADGSWMFFYQPTPLALNNTQGFTEIAAISGTSSLMINEVSSVSEAKDNQDDWIELYNSTPSDMDISGYFLSDSRNDLKKWQIGSAQIGAGGYTVISNHQDGEASGKLGISLSGETLYLSNPQGLVLDQFDTGVLRPGISKGRVPDDTAKTVFYSTPTKGEPNGGSTVNGYCAAPLFSAGGGYQSAPVNLEITDTTPGASIFYTLDGSTPTPNATPYTDPIPISATQTVRAIAVAEGKLPSDQTVATYLFEDKHSLPVICLSITESDKDYIFASQTRGDGRERAGYVEYYEPDGTLGVKFPAGMRIAGAGTRLYRQRSINLYLRGGYGQSEITYPFFKDYDITTFKSLSLRNMGQDSSDTRLKDAFFHMAVNGMNIDNMQTRFAVVYINGHYWGLYEFKENQNEDYFAARYGIDPDKVEMSRNQYIYVGQKAGINHVLSVAKGNTSNDDQFAKYTDIADSAYFMDYLIATSFFNSSDYYNQKYAHTSDNAMKWRPMFYDLDLAMGGASGFNLGTLCSSAGINGPMHTDGTQFWIDTGLYYGFRKNAAWCDAFVTRYAEVLNTVLTEDKLLSLYDEMVDSMRDEMPRTIDLWGQPSSISSWESKIDDLRGYIKNRRQYAIKGLQSYFNLSNEKIAELFPNG